MPAMRALSCSVLLTDNNANNGPLMLVPGSHRQFISCVGQTPNEHYKQSLKKQEYGVPDPVSLQLLVEQGGIQAMTAKAGSVVFFDCNTMHGSNSNISPWPRANVFMVYNSMENTLGPPKYGLTPSARARARPSRRSRCWTRSSWSALEAGLRRDRRAGIPYVERAGAQPRPRWAFSAFRYALATFIPRHPRHVRPHSQPAYLSHQILRRHRSERVADRPCAGWYTTGAGC